MTSESRIKTALKIIAATGKLSPESLSDLTEDEKKLIETVFQQDMVVESLSFMEEIDSGEDWKSLKERLNKSERIIPKTRVIPLWRSIIQYAAMIVVFFAVGYAIYNKGNVEVEQQISHNDGIKLLIGDEQTRILDYVGNEDIIVSGKIIARQNGSVIKYNTKAVTDQLIFHQIVIPHGKMFDIELSDGTVVHLNSGSKMKYPVNFLEGLSREVFIEGEAYFDVSSDKRRPFIVNADDVSIKVLGTEFTISTYSEDPEINAVLVEGSISMSNSYFPEEIITLTPGTKGSWDKNNHKTSLEEVNINDYIGWMKGELVFRNSPFSNMLKKLERKYDVEIENNNSALSNKVFNASFSEDVESIEDVLKYISEIYPFNYRISDQRVLIY
jgi:hypothetical protein